MIVNRFFIAALLLISACRKESSPDESPEVRVDVRTSLIRTAAVDDAVIATGSTSIRREAQLRSPIAGTITNFRYFNGDAVHSGGTIAEIRGREAQASLQGAETLLREATTPAQRTEAEEALRLAHSSSNTVTIRAPFTGVLENKQKNETELVAEGDAIASLVDPASIVFLADIPSRRAGEVRPGQRVEVRLPNKPGPALEGRVRRIESQVNPGDQTARVEVALDGAHPGLRGSQFGEASIIVGRKNRALLVPASALLRDDEKNLTRIMLVGEDSVAHSIVVQPGIRKDSLVQVSGPPGLAAGQIVITEGGFGLPDSTKVRILP